ncbi:MAG: alkaline phosphatase family protein [Solirubrobacterales bacterium]
MAIQDGPSHIVVVVEENKTYGQIIGNPKAEFINTLAGEGTFFTHYQAITNPSQPNYIALFSGDQHGVTGNRPVMLTDPTLADQVEAAGGSFTGFAEDGAKTAVQPWLSFTTTIDNGANFASFPTTAAGFDSLPTVSFVAPDSQHNMHSASIAKGDAWLRDHLGAYAEWAKTHDSLLIVTFDEGHPGNNHVPTIVVGDHVPVGHVDAPANHYTLLRAIEAEYGLTPLGHAAEQPIVDLQTDHGTGAQPASTADWLH